MTVVGSKCRLTRRPELDDALAKDGAADLKVWRTQHTTLGWEPSRLLKPGPAPERREPSLKLLSALVEGAVAAYRHVLDLLRFDRLHKAVVQDELNGAFVPARAL